MYRLMIFLGFFISALQAEDHKIEILLTVPRSVSTAFERSIMERGDHKVFHEPWGACMLYHQGYNNLPPLPELLEAKNYLGIKSLFYSYAQGKHVFAKDMIWLMYDDLLNDTEFLSNPNVVITLLIRNPAYSIDSFYTKIRENEKVSEEMAIHFAKRVFRYDLLLQIAEKIYELRGEWPLIIESDDLCNRPQTTMKNYCQKTGIDFMQDALTWEKGMPEEWVQFGRWTTDAAQSEGFFLAKRLSPEARFSSLPDEYKSLLEAIYQEQLPYYEKLKSLVLK